ncbi:MAG: AbrB/MazE/SpoVT family DNA-binding domain-containing protein [Spirochaetes bacterium]|jgi:AbrB family looped-hinge helix DNA binding protein|nr:AbrB/MazE/SpoVT family DNA-binding domain-containing protein [Spirochaetota bacterium]
MTTYDVEAVVTVDGRGQVVLPREVRTALGLQAGSKLAVVIKHAGGRPCCVNLLPTAALQDGVRRIIDADS